MLDRKKLTKLSKKEIPENSTFWSTPQPILWIAANDLAKNPKTFYKNAAEILNFKYIEEISTKINAKESIAAKIGPKKLSVLQFFPFIEKDKIIIACPDPFQSEEMIETYREENPDKEEIEVVIAPLSVIRTAITNSLYNDSTSTAENELLKLNPELSSKGAFSRQIRIMLAILSLAFLIVLFWQPPAGFLAFFLAANFLYLLLNPVKFIIAIASLRTPITTVSDKEVKGLNENSLPVYTLLVPTKDEASMVPSLISNLKKIDYPKDKLDIKLITEVTDCSTIEAFNKEGITTKNEATSLNTVFEIVKVPTGKTSTKPRSCNYALQFSKGRMTVIYDAEDKPDPKQLKKAYATFLNAKLNTLCVQAKLNFYNARQNLLTRFFALEYGYWYDFMIPGLQVLKIPIPLGGTSNHFLTKTLHEIGTWDPYNVTEDADLGWRLSRLGYRTAIINSYTLEEANSQIINWIRQRTRWQKGFLLTTLVHARHPLTLWRELGAYGAISSVILFATNFLLPLINPILWIFFVLWYVPPLFGLPAIGFTIPDWLHTIGTINLIIGNGFFILIHAMASIAKKQWTPLLLAPFLPFYWILLSVASYRSVYQALTKPYSWEKTKHGLSESK